MSQSHGAGDYIVFSVYQSNLTDEENAIAHDAVVNVLTHVYGITDLIQAEGVYQGVPERCIIINHAHLTVVEQLCRMHNQECYMLARTHMHGLRRAYFVYPDGTEEFQGYLREVSQERAEASEGFTYRPDLDRFWIIDDNDDTMMRSSNA